MAGITEVAAYVAAVRSQHASKAAGEHAYRPALYHLMASHADVEAVNDPKKSEHGAPDFVFQRESNRDIILGYAEAKDIDKELSKVEKSEQMKRYAGYRNLFLTNYLDFRFYADGEMYKSISIGHIESGKIIADTTEYQRLADELESFLQQVPQAITSGRRLAEIMGAKARRICEDLHEYFKEGPPENEDLVKIYDMMRHLLVHDLDRNSFADMYAQTLVYGLFVARYNDTTLDTFSRNEARVLVPKTNPFLLSFFDHIVGPNFDDRLARAVDELCQVFTVSDVRGLVHQHLREDDGAETRDPIIHFYEDFLEAYDPSLRRALGAYYTPLPVVRFIVRQVDRLLKEEFGIRKGLADSSKIKYKVDDGQARKYRAGGRTRTTVGQEIDIHRVQILDPAVGTATFLNEIIKFIYEGFQGQEGRWPSYVSDDLISRLNGFECMMAPYTIAHLKLAMTLEETGVPQLPQRLRVFLTNSLEEGIKRAPDLFSFGLSEVVSEESRQAGTIKSDHPIMVVIGNPPYAAQSNNDTTYANSLVAKYKFEPGGHVKLQERKHWLHDDYLKFIALAEDLVSRNGEGIVAMITAHGYLHNKTSRGVRWHLAKTFDKIYALDLHGNVKRKETSPDGDRDQNVFDIQQGVSILFAVKQKNSSGGLAKVFSADMWGSRSSKFDRLESDDVEWIPIDLDSTSMRFTLTDHQGREEYQRGVGLNELFIVHNTGLVTARDKVVVDIDGDALRKRIERFADRSLSDDEIRSWLFAGRSARKYAAGDTRGWKLPDARELVAEEDIPSKIKPLGYRPFDSRKIYYSRSMVDWPRMDVMNHMIWGPNIGMVFRRQMPESVSPTYFFIADSMISDGYIKSDNKGSESIAPLYLYHEDGGKTYNLDDSKVKLLKRNLDCHVDGENIFDYVYGVVHSPTYRAKYGELLKDDFPRIPIPASDEEFLGICGLGSRLRELHLMQASDVDDFSTTYPVAGSDVVESIRRIDNSIWINSTQYFGKVTDVAWNFVIGAYRPALKWLEQRKGRHLSSAEIDHFQRIVKVLESTDTVMRQLDAVPAHWAG